MNTFQNFPTPPNRQRVTRARGEQGWVLLATVILSAVAASLTVTWARHAVLQKSQLEMSSGASEAEEATRSGLERTRQKMRSGNPPGTEADGEEDVVTTDSGDIIICEREIDPVEKSCKRRVRALAQAGQGLQPRLQGVGQRSRALPHPAWQRRW